MSIDLESAVLEDEPPPPPPERTRKPRSDKGQTRGSRGTGRPSGQAKLRAVADDLLVPWATLAAATSMTAPTFAAVMLRRGEKTIDSVVKIAADHPRMMKALTTASKMGPFAEIGQTILEGILAAALDFGRLPPEHPFAIGTGMTQLYADMHPEWSPSVPEPNGVPQNFAFSAASSGFAPPDTAFPFPT